MDLRIVGNLFVIRYRDGGPLEFQRGTEGGVLGQKSSVGFLVQPWPLASVSYSSLARVVFMLVLSLATTGRNNCISRHFTAQNPQ